MSFDITSVLKNVPDLGTEKEQITYLPIDKLDPDENNFYSLEKIEDLADNIATIGLQQPLRVRYSKTPGRYIIISGHRRRAAILLLRDGEDDAAHMFDQGVPCIIELGKASEALQELRLIYANSSTRVMGSAEISKQAKRVEALLYQLQEEGMQFPGRMRDHVAEACQISKSKLSRLNAIRNNLLPDLLEYFDNGQLNETTAYELQKVPVYGQKEIARTVKRSGDASFIDGRSAAHCAQYAEAYMADRTCQDGSPCPHHEKRFIQALRTTMCYEKCTGGCCLKCHNADSCSYACPKVKAKQKAAAEKKKEQREAEKKKEAKDREAKCKRILKTKQDEANRLLPLIEQKGLGDKTELPQGYWGYSTATVKTYRRLAAGEFSDNDSFYDEHLIPTSLSGLTKMADLLGCSIDYVVGRSTDPNPGAAAPAAGPQWSTGTPAGPGMYETRVSVTDEDTPQVGSWQRLEWFEGAWCFPSTHSPMSKGVNVIRWVKLPEV